MLRYIADEEAKALADEKAKKALATKESGEGEGDSEGDEGDEGDDEVILMIDFGDVVA